MKTWNSAEVVPELARAAGVDADVAGKVVDAILDFVREALVAGNAVELKDLGAISCPSKGKGKTAEESARAHSACMRASVP